MASLAGFGTGTIDVIERNKELQLRIVMRIPKYPQFKRSLDQ
jgi:hypothetical protein